MKETHSFLLTMLMASLVFQQDVAGQNVQSTLKSGVIKEPISSSTFATILSGGKKEDIYRDKLHPKRLYIGDKVPLDSFEFNGVRNYPGGRMKLSEFKGKFIILDFWNKYCTVCIQSFPKMEKLQAQFKDDIQILLVTKNTEQDLADLFVRSTNLKETKLPIIMGETILTRELFPSGGVPYHVWLDREGKVVATTYGAETTAESLRALILAKPLDVVIKNEIFDEDLVKELRNEQLSLLHVGNGVFLPHLKYLAQLPVPRKANDLFGDKLLQPSNSFPYYSMFMDFVPGDIVWQKNFFVDKSGAAKGFRIFNKTVNQFYELAYVDPDIKVARIIAEGKAKFLYERLLRDSSMGNSKSNLRTLMDNKYSYESSLPFYSFENARKLLQQDLSRFLGMKGTVVERPLPCLVLTRLGTEKEEQLWAEDQTLSKDYRETKQTKEGFIFSNVRFLYFFTELKLANQGANSPLFIDETGFEKDKKYKNKIDILLKCLSLSANPENLDNLRVALAEYGLGLKEETRAMKVLVLNEAF